MMDEKLMQQILDDESVMAGDVKVYLNYEVNGEERHAQVEIHQMIRSSKRLEIRTIFNPSHLANPGDSLSIYSAAVEALGQTIVIDHENDPKDIDIVDKLISYNLQYVQED